MTVNPAVCNHTFYQNATWEFYARFCTGAKATTYDPATGLFTTVDTHGRSVNDPVILTKNQDTNAALPLGFTENTVYYVVADGLTTNSFKLSDTLAGVPIAPTGTDPIELVSSDPLNLSGYILDADIATSIDGAIVASFSYTYVDANTGYVRFFLPAATSGTLETGTYQYDVSLTDGSGERYYYMQGTITNKKTVSRNT